MATDERREERDRLNKKLGKKGERAARSYLRRKGWRIVKKNYKNPFGEVDIIAKQGDTIAFIEVKTRTTDIHGTPSEAVMQQRQLKYIRAANFFFSGAEPDYTVRFDVIEVFAEDRKIKINHIENAFY